MLLLFILAMILLLCDHWLHCNAMQAMEAALGSSKDYTLKQYLVFANKLQEKAKVLLFYTFYFERTRA